jgi:signal transduction histidine kinase
MKTFNIRYRSIEKLKVFLDKKSLKAESPFLIQLFTSLPREKSTLLVKSLKDFFPNATIVGCSTDGEIINAKVLQHNTLISLTQFDASEFTACFVPFEEDCYASGQQLAQSLTAQTKVMVLFSTFQGLQADRLLSGIQAENAHQDILLCGAVAGDGGGFKESYVLDDKGCYTCGVVALCLGGENLQASHYHHHDWEPVSRKFVVDKVAKNKLLMIEQQNPKELYQNYVGSEGDFSLQALQFPFVRQESSGYLSQVALEELQEGSIRFANTLKAGDVLQIAYANIDEAQKNQNEMLETLKKKPIESLFVYSSSARRRFLDGFTQQELDTLGGLGDVGGFFGYGEFISQNGKALLSGQCFSVLALSESDKVSPNRSKKSKVLFKTEDYKTIKILRNIAQVSSSELETLNQKLERRVQEGIQENRKKDSIMIHNSKLAQLGEMMGLIAHQWRQPLSSISATASGMQIKFELETWTPEYVQSSLEHIEQYVTHLSETINDFSDFFKPSKKRSEVEAREMVKKALFILSPLLTKESVLVIKKFNSTNTLHTYANEVVQVILNLVKNAVNALASSDIKNPEIYISEYLENGNNIIEISDNAGGIDNKIIDKIFEPYFSTHKESESMGLGLYMSKFIIEESCGGTLEVLNTKEGAKFTITLH